jgi:hypothetical protein
MAFTDLSYGVYQGVLYAAKRTMNGAQIGGWLDMGDSDEFIIDPKPKYEDINESRTGLGFNAAHVITQTDLNVKLRTLQGSQANWERAIWGTASGSVAGATVSGEAVTIYPGPSMVPLAHPGVSAVTVSVGTVDTDYTVDAANGALLIVSGAPSFTDVAGTAATVSYTFATYTGTVEAYTTQQPILQLRLHGINTANNQQPTIVECYQWAPDMSSTLNFIDKKHMAFELGGMLLQDQTKPLPTADNPFSQFFKVTRA